MERDIESRFLAFPASFELPLRSVEQLQLNNEKHVSVSELRANKPEDSFGQNVSESLVPLVQHRLGQMHQPITLNVLLLGQPHSGTTPFLDALALLFPPSSSRGNTHSFTVSSYFRLSVTLFPPQQPHVPPAPWLRDVLAFLDSSMALYRRQKRQLHPGQPMDDPRVHLCLYFFQGPFIKEQDVDLMAQLAQQVNLIPLLALGDNHTAPETMLIKERMRAKTASLGLYDLWAGEEVQAMPAGLKERLKGGPFGESPPFQMVAGLPRPHGQSRLQDPGHSDFLFFVSLLVNHLVLDLRDTTHRRFYRQWRQREEDPRTGKQNSFSSRVLLFSSLLMFGSLGSAILLRHHSQR